MNRFLMLVAGLTLSAAAGLVSGAGATRAVPSGDTCTATGSGTNYTLVIVLPPSAGEQGAFAVGASGVGIRSIKSPGNAGTLTTTGLPALTSASWVLTTPTAPPGSSVTLSVTTSRAVAKSFRVVAATSPTTGAAITYYDPMTCLVGHGSAVAGNQFSVAHNVSFDKAVGGWHLLVTIPGAGTVSATQLEPTTGGSGSKSTTAKPMVTTHMVGLKSGGTVTLTLRPTSSGQAALETSGSLKVKLNVAFEPKNGKSASKIVGFTLREA